MAALCEGCVLSMQGPQGSSHPLRGCGENQGRCIRGVGQYMGSEEQCRDAETSGRTCPLLKHHLKPNDIGEGGMQSSHTVAMQSMVFCPLGPVAGA